MNNIIKVGATINGSEYMTSREIATITGKPHNDVLKAIRAMENAWVKVNGVNFPLVEYTDAKGEKRPMYSLNKDEVSYINQRFMNKYLAEFCGQQAIVCTTRFETAFGKQLIETLTPLGIEVETQKFVCGKYRIDFYLPKYKLAIEYDEQQHQFQHEADNQRMKDIKKELGCSFIRLDYKNIDATNVGIVLSEIFNQ